MSIVNLGHSGHLSIFTLLKHLMMLLKLLKYNFFQGFIFTPYQRHWYHLGPCSSDFFKVKTLLNNAFKFSQSNTTFIFYGLSTFIVWLHYLSYQATMRISSVESQKGINDVQRCSFKNQKDDDVQWCSKMMMMMFNDVQRCSVNNQKELQGTFRKQFCITEQANPAV